MKRTAAVVFFVMASLVVLGLWAVAPTPKIPTGMGYCVTVHDQDDNLVGVTFVPLHRPDPAKLDEFMGSVRNAVSLIGLRTGRQDIIGASAQIQLKDNPIPPLLIPKQPRHRIRDSGAISTQGNDPTCHMVCVCGSPIYGTPASDITTDSLRKRPGPPTNIIGCGGPCSTCEHCWLTCK